VAFLNSNPSPTKKFKKRKRNNKEIEGKKEIIKK
jgi:hypothetical protein